VNEKIQGVASALMDMTKPEQEFIVSMTATSVWERNVRVKAKTEQEALEKVRHSDIFEKEAENGTFNMLDFERGQDWVAVPAKGHVKRKMPFEDDEQEPGDYTEVQ
jgi:hypothetical protein